MMRKTGMTIAAYGLLSLAGAGPTNFFSGSLSISQTAGFMQVPPDSLRLNGVVRDFTATHPDFGVTNLADMGHYAGSVGGALGPDGRPVFTGNGQKVDAQWYDKDGNPIMPYAGPGLPFGHFDVDVYDGPSTSELYHEHEYDDTKNVDYLDVLGDPDLMWNDLIGPMYPNDLRVVFWNVHNGGGGTFTFQANGPVVTGTTADGFMAVFQPSKLTQLRVNFVALAALRATQPGNSQGDAIDRDDAFAIRVFDVVTNAMVYEVTAYHHDKGLITPDVATGSDACGVPISDTVGTFGAMGNGAITGGASFDQWFHDELGTNLSTAHSIDLQRNAVTGVYEYITDAFYPADRQLLDDGSGAHNNFFTYSISASFTYNQCTDQFLEIAANDDVWVYIDNKLVIDLGGTATPTGQRVSLDRLNLVDGQTYNVKLFYAHRRDAGNSLFSLRSSFPMVSDPLPVVSAGFD